jgi:uracil-DNA glycosylase
MHPATQALLGQLKTGNGWRERLEPEFSQPYMESLGNFLAAEEKAGKTIFPKAAHCFNALNTTVFDDVSVVILGQDPYHGPGQAHGLCFSVRPGVEVPPSLVNIFKELNQDLGTPIPDHGCLQPWAEQGVLLLNSVLTVSQGNAGSHRGQGWETFTDRVIRYLNDERESVVFLLWGSYAQKKGSFIDRNRHLVLEGPHPSPLSAYRGFFGGRYFSRANEWLSEKGLKPVEWGLPDQKALVERYRRQG